MHDNYYVVVHERTGKLLVSNSRLPIYWKKKVALQQSYRHEGYVVRPIQSINMEAIIEDAKPDFDHKLAIQFCTNVCAYWGVTFAWLTNGRRNEDRPIIKKILSLLVKKKYPTVTLKQLAQLMGHSNHAGIHRMLKNANDWMAVNDPLIMKYYEPVKHLFNDAHHTN